MKEFIKEIFKQLDGYTCMVNSGGLLVEGSMEGNLLISYKEHEGLRLKTLLKWNDNKPQFLVIPILNKHLGCLQKEKDKHLEKISFEARDQISDELIDNISNMYVTVGLISIYGITDISLTDYEGKLQRVEINYKDSKTIIRGLKKIE